MGSRMSQRSYDQQVGLNARRLRFENATMKSLIAPDLKVVDVDAVKRQAELLKQGADSASSRDVTSAVSLLQFIVETKDRNAPIPVSDYTEHFTALIESTPKHFNRDDLKD